MAENQQPRGDVLLKWTFPEFIQHEATAENISRAALELLGHPDRQNEIKRKLADVVAALGGQGASRRSAAAIWELLNRQGRILELRNCG